MINSNALENRIVVSPSEITPMPSATTQSLIALSQDITALLSLSIETTASMMHDMYRKALGTVGLGEVVSHRPTTQPGSSGEAGRGLAVVVLGSGEGE